MLRSPRSAPVSAADAGFNVGYLWMLINCVATATYLLTMRKRIKLTGFKDWDSMMYNNLLSIPILVLASILFEDWGSASLARNLCVCAFALPRSKQGRTDSRRLCCLSLPALPRLDRSFSSPSPSLELPPFSSRTRPPGASESRRRRPTRWSEPSTVRSSLSLASFPLVHPC